MTRVKRGHHKKRRMKKASKASKASQYAFFDRRSRKRSFRSLWICRLNAQQRQCGFHYSSSRSVLNRKILAQLLLYD